MNACNEFGRNNRDFVLFMNNREKQWNLGELYYEAWKQGYEPSAVSAYLHSELQYAATEFSMKMESAERNMPDADLKSYETFEQLNDDRQKSWNRKQNKGLSNFVDKTSKVLEVIRGPVHGD